MGQLRTWFSMLAYSVVPDVIAAPCSVSLRSGFRPCTRAETFAGTGLGDAPLVRPHLDAGHPPARDIGVPCQRHYRYLGGGSIFRRQGMGGMLQQPGTIRFIGQPLSFYLFKVPFYSVLLRFVLTVIDCERGSYLLDDRARLAA
jgi:hypothetical protein